MRHRKRGRILGRNASHRHAMWRNMASSLLKTLRPGEDDENTPEVKGRIVTTVAKAKEIRPYVEKLVTIAKKSLDAADEANRLNTSAPRNSAEWKAWRDSPKWNEWNQTIAPAVAARRRAFALLRDKLAVTILFDEIAPRFQTRPGGYTRVVRLPKVRLGDAGPLAILEFVGVNDRVKGRKSQSLKRRRKSVAEKSALPTSTPAPAAEVPPEPAPASEGSAPAGG